MYFTHDNIARFMVEAIGVRELTRKKWRSATHPDQRLPISSTLRVEAEHFFYTACMLLRMR